MFLDYVPSFKFQLYFGHFSRRGPWFKILCIEFRSDRRQSNCICICTCIYICICICICIWDIVYESDRSEQSGSLPTPVLGSTGSGHLYWAHYTPLLALVHWIRPLVLIDPLKRAAGPPGFGSVQIFTQILSDCTDIRPKISNAIHVVTKYEEFVVLR